MIEYQEAIECISANILNVKKTKLLKSDKALGRYVAEDIFSPLDIPFFDNSAMDGYAISFESGRNRYQIVSEIAADKQFPQFLKQGEAARIFTGAPVPSGTDTVVKQEICFVEKNLLTFDLEQVKKGMNVRYQGTQNKKGDIIVPSGTLITPSVSGLIASVGLNKIVVYKKPKVAVIITGNELQEIGKPLKYGQVYNSNGLYLKHFLKNLGIKNVKIFFAKDDFEKLYIIAQKAMKEADFVIFTGGISVGDYDFVKDVLVKEGVEELFYKVKQKPGKPLFVGKKEHQWIFALPGNPASVISCAHIYLKPTLMEAMGAKDSFQPQLKLSSNQDFENNGPLSLFLKVKIVGNHFEILPHQESFNMMVFNEADAIVRIPPNTSIKSHATLLDLYLLN
jgi:molybdopterin molybdotransferase